MKKKTIISALIFVVVVTCCMLVACNSTEFDTDGKTKIVFELEGGIYKNSERSVTYWVDYKDGTDNLIYDFFSANEKDKIERNGYVIEGWYREKTVDGENVTYSGKWDFENDKVGSDGVTLYAKWVPAVVYTYRIYYKSASGEDVAIGSPYKVNAGASFMDLSNYAEKKKPENHTFIKFVDAEGNDWDKNFRHPGGDEDLEIKVYAEYMEGDWYIVDSLSSLKSSKNSKKDIYLASDIDMGGAKFAYGDFKDRVFEGNGHTISNFKVQYDGSKNGLCEDKDGTINTLYIGVFGNIENSEIRHLTFADVAIELNTSFNQIKRIRIAPLCIYAINSEFVDVAFSGTYSTVKSPESAEMLITLTTLYSEADAETSCENCTVTVTADAEA